jgi:hypothetical protein
VFVCLLLACSNSGSRKGDGCDVLCFAAIGGRDRLASAVGLIMGTAVGPGILGLPAATLQAGLLPSSAAIVAAWAYVMADILLVAELSYAGKFLPLSFVVFFT